MELSYLLAVLAAGSNAISNVLQRRVNRDLPDARAMRPQLFLDLVRRPLWVAALGTMMVSFVLLAWALDVGRLAAVDPIIVLELPLTVLLAAKLLGGSVTRRDWWAIAALSVGLCGLVGFLSPGAGTRGHAAATDWIVGSALAVGAVALIVVVSLRLSGSQRALLLGAGTGMAFGLTAAFMKGMTTHLGGGALDVLSAWPTYAMVATGIAGLFLAQNALQAGRLLFAQPGMTLLEPLVSILWGVTIFHEATPGGLRLALASFSGAIMAIGALTLIRSPLLVEDRELADEHLLRGVSSPSP